MKLEANKVSYLSPRQLDDDWPKLHGVARLLLIAVYKSLRMITCHFYVQNLIEHRYSVK